MALLSLARTIGAELIDARGQVAVMSGDTVVQGHLRELPQLFVEGAHLNMTLLVDGDSFEALCRVLDDAVAVEPGSRVNLEVLRASPAGISGIEPFDLVPLNPINSTIGMNPINDIGLQAPSPLAGPAGGANSGPMRPAYMSLPPQDAFPEELEEPTGVLGTLKEMPVTEIVQSLAQANKDALIEVKPKGGDPGTIGVERGRVVYCRTLTKSGDHAFFELMRHTRGAFRVRYGRRSEVKNITRDTTFLLLEGARQLDEFNSGKNPIVSGAFSAPRNISGISAPDGINLEDQLDAEHTEKTLRPVSDPWRVPTTSSGLFARFFDEAGVTTPPPMPMETMRFQSLHVPGLTDLDDAETVDSDATTKERKTLPSSSP